MSKPGNGQNKNQIYAMSTVGFRCPVKLRGIEYVVRWAQVSVSLAPQSLPKEMKRLAKLGIPIFVWWQLIPSDGKIKVPLLRVSTVNADGMSAGKIIREKPLKKDGAPLKELKKHGCLLTAADVVKYYNNAAAKQADELEARKEKVEARRVKLSDGHKKKYAVAKAEKEARDATK